ncbi:MAG: sensor histidine kinase [Kiritimatiellae bacterium]|nr:sensor histidine kinase [Kiritimatiellia bacterium]
MTALSFTSLRYSLVLAAFLTVMDASAAQGRRSSFCATGIVVHATAGTMVLQRDDGPNLYILTGKHSPEQGDRVIVSGRVNITRFNEDSLALDRLKVLGHGEVPPPREMRVEDLMDHPMKNERVSIVAEIEDFFVDEVDVRFYYLLLKSGPHRIYGALSRKRVDVALLDKMLGATVRLTGTTYEHHGARSFSGNRIALDPLDQQHIVSRAETDLSKLPTIEGMEFTLPVEIARLPRHRIDGTVLAVWQHAHILVRAANVQVVGVSLRSPSTLPQVGESVVAAGYPSTDLFNLLLSGGKWQPSKKPAAADAHAKRLRGEELFTDVHGNHSIESSYHGMAVCLCGRVIHGDAGKLEVDLGKDTIRVYAGEHSGGFDHVLPGSEIELTGVVVLESGIWRAGLPLPRISGVSVVTRHDGDLKVLRHPPWWTPGRILIAFASLISLISALAVWNRVLMRIASRRSRELAHKQLAKERSELKTEERTRLAIELHDSLSQNLSGIGCQLVATRLAMKPGSAAYSRLETAERMLLSTRTELKRCLFDLREDLLEDMDFERAIRQTLKSIVGRNRLRLRFHVARSVMDDSRAHTILSVIRELVSNAIRHGHATTVIVAGTLQHSADSARGNRILFSVRDNGCGFDPESAAGPSDGHFGLTGVRDRVNRLDGEFGIRSAPGRTYARISIPL